ncbi:MAG: Crp/Fnr family transcriptional regulator [Bacteroidia bacterium]|nr:Crp/Fnr family transcriptional regulator [Bacteroidia bacterium]
MDAFSQILRSAAPLPDQEIEKFLDMRVRQELAVGEYFIRAGEIPRKIAFIQSGLFRYVYINAEGKEFTKSLFTEHSILSSYSSMIQKIPSYFYIEALESSEILSFDFEGWQGLQKGHPAWTQFLLALVQKGFMVKEKRERELLLLDAEQRYRIFLQEFPDMDKRIKQSIIASYLGISPESLSRIRKNMNGI